MFGVGGSCPFVQAQEPYKEFCGAQEEIDGFMDITMSGGGLGMAPPGTPDAPFPHTQRGSPKSWPLCRFQNQRAW